MSKIKLFISSVQSEFEAERKALANFLRADALLSKFFEPFLFEELPAIDKNVQQVYLNEVESSNIYLGIIGKKYGYRDSEGISPTSSLVSLLNTFTVYLPFSELKFSLYLVLAKVSL